MLGYPPTPPGSLAADRPTRRPPRFGSTKGGGSPPLQPPKLSHTPRGHTLAGGGPRSAWLLPFSGELWMVAVIPWWSLEGCSYFLVDFGLISLPALQMTSPGNKPQTQKGRYDGPNSPGSHFWGFDEATCCT